MAQKSVGFTGRGGKVSAMFADGADFTKIAQVKKVSFGGSRSDMADITNLDSEGNQRERIPTLIDPGTCTLDIVANQVDAGQLALAAAFYAQTLIPIKVEYPAQRGMQTGLVRTFDAYVSTNGMAGLDVADASSYSTELTITGVITDTPGA